MKTLLLPLYLPMTHPPQSSSPFLLAFRTSGTICGELELHRLAWFYEADIVVTDAISAGHIRASAQPLTHSI